MIRVRVASAIFSVIFVMASACAGAGGSAHPISDTSNSAGWEDDGGESSDGLPKDGAPEVADPLDVSMLKNDLCILISDSQAQQFDGTFDGLEHKAEDDSPRCLWKYDGNRYPIGYMSYWIREDNPDGISKYYGDISEQSATVEPIDPVLGYPAIRFDVKQDDPGSCVYKVGVRDDVVITFHVLLMEEHPSRDSPCDVAREFSGVAIENLKEAQ